MLVREGESEHAARHSNSGATPLHPIRTKALWRALRAGKLWLIVPFKHFSRIKDNTFNGMKFKEVYPDPHCPDDEGYITWPLK
jgi:hypothetical protein